MTSARFTTIPVRCPHCGQQTHKTLEAIAQEGGYLVCACGARTQLDMEQFAAEIGKSEADIKDFGRNG